MGFASLGLDPALVRNLVRLGYRTPWPIQAAAIPEVLAGRDLVGIAHTGRGKTAAFAAPIGQRLREHNAQRVPGEKRALAERLRALVICPTRELAHQVAEETRGITTGASLRTACVYGKVGLRPQAEALAKGVDILVGTPGRLRELMEAGALSLAHLRILVLDEADRMLDMGFLPQVEWLAERMPEGVQRLMFSATMPKPVVGLAARHLHEPARVEVDPESTTVEHVRQHVVRVADRRKVEELLALLGGPPRRTGALVFCRTRRRVGWVAAALRRHGWSVGALHGDRTPAQRRAALAGFDEGELDVVVATDVAARGLHVERVRTVVNYDVPLLPEEYVHRVGRAGHGGGAGEAFTLLSSLDADAWAAVLKHVKPSVDETPARTGSETEASAEPRRGARTTAAKEPAPATKARPKKAPAKKAPATRAVRTGAAELGPGRAKRDEPRDDAPRGRRGKGKAARDPSRGGRVAAGRTQGDKPRGARSRASQPIAKGERPGGGVRRRTDG